MYFYRRVAMVAKLHIGYQYLLISREKRNILGDRKQRFTLKQSHNPTNILRAVRNESGSITRTTQFKSSLG